MSTESVKQLNSLFSTADAEDVEFSFDGCDLTLKFNDWQERPFTILFRDVEYMLVDDDIDYEKFSGDCPHEVGNSELLKKKKLSEPEYKHYMICFNAWSNIEIASMELEII